jgi:hypothetical protein
MKKEFFFLTITIFSFSCKKNYNGEPLTPETENQVSPYYLDAKLLFKDSINPVHFQLSVDGEAWLNYGRNHFVTSHHDTYSELYTGWDYIDTHENQPNWTPGKLESLENEYGYTYGSVITNGTTFGFFHPDGKASWDEATVEGFFVEGKEFVFGNQAGNAEISHKKNLAPLGNTFRGLITTSESNEEGFLRVGKVVDASSKWNNDNYHGKQVTFTFKCKMYKQYTEAFAADYEGTSVVFIHYEE